MLFTCGPLFCCNFNFVFVFVQQSDCLWLLNTLNALTANGIFGVQDILQEQKYK